MNDYSVQDEYLMGENVNFIVELYQSQLNPLPEGVVRYKDLQAAADMLGEPLFVSKGEDVYALYEQTSKMKLFEKNLLLNFSAVRDRYMEVLKEALYSLEKKHFFSDKFGYKGIIVLLVGFDEHLDRYYHVFYPHSYEYIKNDIKDKVELLWDNRHGNEYRSKSIKEDGFYHISEYPSIEEKTFWYASTYTREFLEALNKTIEDYGDNELDIDSGLRYKGFDGIKIDEENETIEFCVWDSYSDLIHYRFVAEIREYYKTYDSDYDCI
ncbi:MAG: hypothetical protein J5529_12630 [Prevotella sp.]|nr:hypothetical protein [Prevotella sp.]